MFEGEKFGKFGKLQQIRQHFLVQNFPFYKSWYIASQLNCVLKLYKITLSFQQILQTRQQLSQLASATLIKLLSYFCRIMFQLAHNQQVYLIDYSQVFMISNYKPLLSSMFHSQLVSYIVLLHSQTLFSYRYYCLQYICGMLVLQVIIPLDKNRIRPCKLSYIALYRK